jgi:hypothetical protein
LNYICERRGTLQYLTLILAARAGKNCQTCKYS